MTPARAKTSIVLFWLGTLVLNGLLLPNRYALRVPVETLRQGPFVLKIRAPGTVEPKRSLILKAEFEGPIRAKFYKEGDRVRKGQLLVEIGRNVITLEHQKKVIALENARNDVIRTKRDVKLAHSLFQKGAVSRSNVEDAERAVVQAAQTLRTAEQDFRQADALWNKNKIVAAFDGTILKDSLGTELNVIAGRELLTLADISEYAVVAKVDELEIGQVKIGQPAEVQFPAFTNTPFSAQVSDMGSQAESGAMPQVPVTLQLKELSGMTPRPNQTATVQIITGQKEETLSVPLTAIDNQAGSVRVWVVSSSGRLRSRAVTLGVSNPDRVEVTQGLQAGERVCATSNPLFADGMKIKAQ